MPTLSSGLLRTGLALKVNQIKLATRSYLRDRTNQATGTVTAYVIAAGLAAAAGVFMMATCLVGATALFRWIEIKYGLFPAFGAVGALLLVAAGTCAALAVSYIRRSPPQFPTLTSRLRVAIAASPLHDQNSVMNDAASAVSYSPSPAIKRFRSEVGHERAGLPVSAGLILAATLLGWAAARRREQSRSGTRRQ
jgi:hypothetical protein